MTRSVRARVGAGLLGLAILLPVTAATPAVAAAADFPKGWEGYHTYAEMVADIDTEVAAHPAIIRKVSIGKSYQGRTIWAVKISDNVTVDENEPEVLFDGLTHSDEHMGLEMTLHIMHWLVDGYGHDSRITTLVNAREIWIVLAVNPDGAEYDISGGKFHFWRKNRQPNAGTTAIGTDINRNFGYRWGIAEGRTSRNPLAITYMGPHAFSTPEARNIRDFLASRVVNGRQQIKAAITFHESGRLVMWPYGYTYTDVPADQTIQDHQALVKLGKLMASTNGYRPEQASDLYLTSGTTRDYEYGTYRIFSYTFELSVVDYPDDSLIPSETGRNKEAVLDLINWASCPVGILGLAVRTARCGVFDDDFEVNRGWARNADGTDTATSGLWSRTAPQKTATATGVKQPSGVTSGRYGMVTGGAAGANPNANDVDGGTTSVTSPPFKLTPAAHQMLQFRYTFAHDKYATSADVFRVQVLDVDAATATTVFALHGAPVERNATWSSASIDLSAYAGRTIRLELSATDAGSNNLVEAAFDDVRVTQPE
jgi:carboxypeptidase T